MKKILLLIATFAFTLSLLCSCSIESDDSNPYSRENIEHSFLNGYGTDDQEIVACQYIYNDDRFKEKYGNNFEIKDALCTSEMENISLFIKGDGCCFVYIEDDIWCVKLNKEYLNKWTVVDCVKCAVDSNDGNIIIDDNDTLHSY